MLNVDFLWDRVQELYGKLRELVDSPRLTIREIRMDEENHNKEGVYVITTPEDNEIVYAGATKTKKIGGSKGRIYDHCKTDFKEKLKPYPEYPQDPDEYYVRYIQIEAYRERMYLEDFAIGVLKPLFNKQ